MISFNYVNKKIVFKGSNDSESKLEFLGILGLFLIGAILLGLSWRKWCDPQIDFGREVYIPWRMANGAKWLRDVDDLYGPLSRFIDAGLFKLFGPGIMVLAWANLVIYLGIVTLLYFLFKKAWGVLASLVSCGIFVAVFSFSQLTVTSNYNYIAPYSQQVTHGFFVSLLLIFALAEWIQKPNIKISFIAGLCWGLTAVLKPEFILAGGLMVMGALAWRAYSYGIPAFKCIAIAFLGMVLPTVLFGLYIASYMPISSAFAAASHAWLNGILIWKDTLTAHLLNSFSGMDNPKANLVIHVIFTLKVLSVLILLLVAAWSTAKITNLTLRQIVFLAICGVIVYLGLKGFNASNIGECLLGLLLIYIAFKCLKNGLYWLKGTDLTMSRSYGDVYRLLLTVFAAALMTRMLLNGRIYQYGFFQAAPAAMVVCAILVGEVSDISYLNGHARRYLLTFLVLLLTSGCIAIIGQSERLLIQKTAPLAQGSDLFYSYPAAVQGMGEIVRSFSETLSKQPKDETLAVLPEGIMINYLSRKVSPVRDILFYGNPNIEGNMLKGFKDKAPDWVVLISRDLSEYGVKRYGAKGESGEAIMAWVNSNYHSVAFVGSDPLIPNLLGGIIYKHNTPLGTK
jgi:hypothetical protein